MLGVADGGPRTKLPAFADLPPSAARTLAANAPVRASNACLFNDARLADCDHRRGGLGPQRKHRHGRQQCRRRGGNKHKLRHTLLPDFIELGDYAMEHLPDIWTTPQSKGKRHLRRPGCGPERGERTIGWSRQRSSDDPAELFPNTLCYGHRRSIPEDTNVVALQV